MNVEVYDQYRVIYFDNVLNKLAELNLDVGESLDQTRYSVFFEGLGSTSVKGTGLTKEEAYNLVTELYLESQSSCEKYDDKIIKLNEGYAEILMFLRDGRILSRVIYTVN